MARPRIHQSHMTGVVMCHFYICPAGQHQAPPSPSISFNDFLLCFIIQVFPVSFAPCARGGSWHWYPLTPRGLLRRRDLCWSWNHYRENSERKFRERIQRHAGNPRSAPRQISRAGERMCLRCGKRKPYTGPATLRPPTATYRHPNQTQTYDSRMLQTIANTDVRRYRSCPNNYPAQMWNC